MPVSYIFSGISSVLTQRVSQVDKIFIHSKSQNDDLDIVYYIYILGGGGGGRVAFLMVARLFNKAALCPRRHDA